MAHAGESGFSKALKETFVAYAFDIGGLIAGFLLAYQVGVFRLAPWSIALYPVVLGVKCVIEGLLSGRLSTALHLGTVYPRFLKNTQSFQILLKAVLVLTLITSVAMSAIALIFGNLLWGISVADFPAILAVVISTMTLGLALLIVTLKIVFFSFKKGLDPDILVYPVISAVAAIFVTVCYFIALTLFFSEIGIWVIITINVANLLAVLYIFPKNLRETEFIKIIQESLAALMIVALIANVTGALLKSVDDRFVKATGQTDVLLVYPAIIGLVGDVGSVVGSTATTKLALGMLRPRFSSIWRHAKNILTAWFVSIIMFVVLALVSFSVHGSYTGGFTLDALLSQVTLLLVVNVISVLLVVVLSYGFSILTFQRGLDPGNFVIPIETAIAATIATIALLTAIALLNVGIVV